MEVLSQDYAQRLADKQLTAWTRPSPYKWNIRRLKPGYTLDIGCGIGRNLNFLGGKGVGVDANPDCVRIAREMGLKAFTPDEFAAEPESFDSLLIAHVLEHVPHDAGAKLISDYLPYVKRGGQVILITPQEAGYASDPTHTQFIDFDALKAFAEGAGCAVTSSFSFPFPRFAGKLFLYNEFVVTARKR